MDDVAAMDVLHAPGNVFRSSEDKVLEQQAGRQIRVVTGRQTDQQTGRLGSRQTRRQADSRQAGDEGQGRPGGRQFD